MTKTNDKTKFVFGAAPKNFTKPVDIVLVSGAVAEIEFNFIYRTRAQFAALVDENIAAANARVAEVNKDTKPEGEASERATVASMYAKMDKFGADYILKIADGWDLDDPFNLESLLRLEDENPGSLTEIGNVYRAAVAEARTKN